MTEIRIIDVRARVNLVGAAVLFSYCAGTFNLEPPDFGYV